MTIGSHQKTIGSSQVRITPRSILDPLGTFDTDPCAAVVRPWACAARNITEAENSLTMDWRDFGRVFLNPPFDRRVVGEFISRMCDHGRGVALVHVRTETEWFRPIWRSASALLWLAGRYIFHNPDGSLCSIEKPTSKHFGKPANSGAPIVLAAFGWADADVLCLCGIDGEFVPLRIPRSVLVETLTPSWREALAAFLRARRGPVALSEIYEHFTAHRKTEGNPNWRAKLRQTLKRGGFERVAPGVYQGAAA